MRVEWPLSLEENLGAFSAPSLRPTFQETRYVLHVEKISLLLRDWRPLKRRDPKLLKRWVEVRSSEAVTVIRCPDVAPGRNPDFIKDTSKDKFAKWKSGDQTLPVDHAHNLAWSIKFVQKCVLGKSISELTPAMPPPRMVIKKERNFFHRSLSSSSQQEPIDLDSPPKKQAKTTDDETLTQILAAELEELERNAPDFMDEHMTMQELEAEIIQGVPAPIEYPEINLDDADDDDVVASD